MEAVNELDVLIVGAGPCGLSCGIEAMREGLLYRIAEKGGLTDAIRQFPVDMTFFSTPELLELGSMPFPTVHIRPTRAEALEYYRRVAEHFDLEIDLYTEVTDVGRGSDGRFAVATRSGKEYRTPFVIFATGYFDRANPLGVPGEELPHVSHYYREPYPFSRTRVVVVGGANSAVEAALDLYRHGAEVLLVHRGASLSDSVKYWVRPDMENRIREGAIRIAFETVVEEIREGSLDLRHETSGEVRTVKADFVLLLIGYRPDETLFREAGMEVDATTLIPRYDPDTFETNVPGLFVAGSAVCGCETGTVFIENGRLHARGIFARIAELRGGGGDPA